MARLSWDLDNPPAQPPYECVDQAKWRSAYRLFQQHVVDRGGRCRCGEGHPCSQYRFAVRGLLDACARPASRIPSPGPPPMTVPGGPRTEPVSRVVAVSRCQWCGRGIELHPLIGWIHAVDGFFVCEEPLPGSPALSVAEPCE